MFAGTFPDPIEPRRGLTVTASADTSTDSSPLARADSCRPGPTTPSLFLPKPHALPLVPSRERSALSRVRTSCAQSHAFETLPLQPRRLHRNSRQTRGDSLLNCDYEPSDRATIAWNAFSQRYRFVFNRHASTHSLQRQA
jgi:hypothetical protein